MCLILFGLLFIEMLRSFVVVLNFFRWFVCVVSAFTAISNDF